MRFSCPAWSSPAALRGPAGTSRRTARRKPCEGEGSVRNGGGDNATTYLTSTTSILADGDLGANGRVLAEGLQLGRGVGVDGVESRKEASRVAVDVDRGAMQPRGGEERGDSVSGAQLAVRLGADSRQSKELLRVRDTRLVFPASHLCGEELSASPLSGNDARAPAWASPSSDPRSWTLW